MATDKARYVIIGNGVAGTTCAEQLRRHDPACEIRIFADEPYPLYNRVALPPFLKGKVPEARVYLKTIDWHEKNSIALHLSTRIERIDPAERTVTDHTGRSYGWDKLLIATGGSPYRLEVPGAEGCSNLLNFQSMDDTKALLGEGQSGRRVVVNGGSFISYELAEGMSERGLEVVWLIRGSHFLRRMIHEDGGRLVDRIARDHGLTMIYGQEIAEVRQQGARARSVVLTDGRELPCDFVAVGIGLKLNTDLLAGTGVDCRKGIVVDSHMQTSVAGIYAAGDVAEFYDSWIHKHNTVGTWNNAIGHGRAAALSMLGRQEPYEEIPEYTTGMFHRKMMAFGITPESHAAIESVHFLDMEDETFRQLFFLEGRLVGGVLIGADLSRKFYKDLIKSREVIPRTEWERLLHPPAPVRSGAATAAD